jgi:hypothetical protein
MDPAWSGRGGGGGGGGVCSASSGAELCRSCVPPAHQFASLLQNLAWLLYWNWNCCSQFAYHHVITQITAYLIFSLIIFCFIMKNSTPPPAPPLARAPPQAQHYTANCPFSLNMRWRNTDEWKKNVSHNSQLTRSWGKTHDMYDRCKHFS